MKYYWKLTPFEKIHLDEDHYLQHPLMEVEGKILFLYIRKHVWENPTHDWMDENGKVFPKEELKSFISEMDTFLTAC